MRSVVLVGWGSRDQAHKMCTNRKMVLFWVGTPQPPTYFATMYTASLMANALHFDPPLSHLDLEDGQEVDSPHNRRAIR
jgi:hypothetical protein